MRAQAAHETFQVSKIAAARLARLGMSRRYGADVYQGLPKLLLRYLRRLLRRCASCSSWTAAYEPYDLTGDAAANDDEDA